MPQRHSSCQRERCQEQDFEWQVILERGKSCPGKEESRKCTGRGHTLLEGTLSSRWQLCRSAGRVLKGEKDVS